MKYPLAVLGIICFLFFNTTITPGFSVGETRDWKPWDWHLKRIHIDGAWEVTNGSQEIVVAVIDTGIAYNHTEIKHAIWKNPDEIDGNRLDDDNNGYVDDVYGWDFRDNDNDQMNIYGEGTEMHWHGTFVTGIIVSRDDGIGTTGVAPNVKIMGLRFLDLENKFSPSFEYQKFIDAIDYAIDEGVNVISLSLYSSPMNPAFEEAILRATDKGIIIVAITGNTWAGGIRKVTIPGNFSSVIAVGATNWKNERASYSNFGPETELVAPSGDPTDWNNVSNPLEWLNSTVPITSRYKEKKGYETSAGTSFACPQVSGVVALMLSANPKLSPAQVRDILQKSAKDLGNPGRDEEYGYGLLNASKAVHLAVETSSNLSTLDASLSSDSQSTQQKTPNSFLTFGLIVLLLMIKRNRKRITL